MLIYHKSVIKHIYLRNIHIFVFLSLITIDKQQLSNIAGLVAGNMSVKNMNTDFTIRIAQPADVLEIKDLFQDTVLNINKFDYSKAEVEDWASCGNDISHIKEMIRTHYFIVATNQQSQVVGFASITQQGYLHSMFVHKDFQGKGIATILLNEIERYATATGIIRITSEVSLTARPFFEKRGYIVMEEQKRKANQLSLTNFWMAKDHEYSTTE